ncbi:receptor-type tyrosine-protein phosphatase C isoform X1 [Pseudochaenichthys georgianus]|uniref:receptor-type tyrosine-protein phosphatase C isoform X1 n=1 Tax=Pseudochaenichthys georgianus TaxID=52239 RepID=UPI00146DD6D3|nr:receptor-type tyrosine-protein phosphatase C isoform X1 [Pseudochaenichthys georgianus]
MAGRCGPTTLLLWAGIIALANYVSTTLPPPTSTNSPSAFTLPISTSTPRNMTETAVISPDNQTTAHKPPLITPTLTSNPPMPSTYSTSISATTAPPTITSPSPKPTNALDLPTNTSQPQTQPPITTSNTSVTTNAKAETQAPPPLECSYTVTTSKTGFNITMNGNFTTGDYIINIKETGRPDTGNSYPLQFSNESLTHEIKRLKPCTEYEHDVAFNDAAGKETPCTTQTNTTKTNEWKEGDIKEGSCMTGYVCYRSDWDISSSLLTSNNIIISAEPCTSDKNRICFKPRYIDICTNLTTTFTSGKCNALSLTRSITADFLNPSEINQTSSTKLPAEIKTDLPPKCDNLHITYSCQENGKPNELKNLTVLEPYTDYNCTGQIMENYVNIKNTTAIKFRIDCDLTIRIIEQRVTNASIGLSWTTDSKNCGVVLPELQKLSYECSCKSTQSYEKTVADKNQFGGTCQMYGLKPYTEYNCAVQPKYNRNYVPAPTHGKQIMTAIGVPGAINNLKVNLLEHNVIHATCDPPNDFNGPRKDYIARLYGGGDVLIETLNPTKCKFEFKALSYSTEYELKVTASNGHNESIPIGETVSTSYNDKAVIGFLVFLIILTSVALLLVVYKIYVLRRRQSHNLGESMMLITTANDEENLLAVEPIAAEVLLETYKRKLADEGRLFLAEFQSMPRIFTRYTVKEAKKACNVPKNRYVDILPYDYNRVQLTTGNGETGCDYINASFIDGYKESKKYIAAQGPKEETVSDFWRMVWEQQSSIIVMVTRCEEGNRVKCAQYWPSRDREAEIFEEFIVKLKSEDHCPDYTIRHLSLTNKREKNSEREVTHIQFMSWPDHGVPGEPHLLLKLRRRVNAFKNFFSGPIVVHCSAGVGRTGTYIGIDAMMECLEAEGRVDIYGYVVRLRRQRCLMVQVEAQYILIHQALLEHNQFGETETTVSELHSTLSTLKQKNSSSEPTLLEDEFERLPIYKNWRTFNKGLTEENKKKNRFTSVIPYDYNRVLLKLDEGRSRDSDPDDDEEEEESSDEEEEDSSMYINASHIDGYWGPQNFIAAQTPLPDTMADFWLMVYQKKTSAIVMLSESSEESNSIYWDKDKKTFGDLEVEVESTDTSPTFITRNMLLRHVKRKETRSVKQFQFLTWSNNELPEKAQELTDMIKDIKQSCGGVQSQRNSPVVVHCNNGSSRSGMFCALWNLLDSAETEKLMDVFQVAKTLRKERQGMLSNLEQYQFLYEALEGVFPVQNGELKAVQASSVDSVQVVNETKAAEKPEGKTAASTTCNDPQGAAESSPLVADGGKEDKKEEPEEVSSVPIETTPLQDTSNGATVTVEV